MSASFFQRRLAVVRSSGRSRGFTLIELMVVVVIIAILASLAVPMFVSRMRERRSQQAALQVAGVYREARMRALGRGAAVLVSYSDGSFQLREGVEGAAAALARTGSADCQSLPTRGCLSNDWSAATSRSVGGFTPADLTDEIETTVLLDDEVDNLDVCFTPLGRSFVRSDGGAWSALNSILRVEVQRGEAGLKRTVVVLPNGTARLGL